MSPRPFQLLLLLLWVMQGALGDRTFSPWEVKGVLAKLEEKNREKFDFASIVKQELKREMADENPAVEALRLIANAEKPTTFYGRYYMHKGKVYSRKSYTKEPTPACNVTLLASAKHNYTRKYSYSQKYSYTRKYSNSYSYKYSNSYKPKSTTSYKNRSTFYGPYYMYRGTLFSRKHYTKYPTTPGKGPPTSPWPPPSPWQKTSWQKGSWKKNPWTGGKWTTIPWYNRTTIHWLNRTTSYGPFFMFQGRVQSRRRYTAEPTVDLPPWMRTKLTFKWTGFYPFTTRYWSRCPLPNYVRRRPVGVRVREDVDFQENHLSNPSLFSDLEISNDTPSAIAANQWIAEHDMDNYLDSEMYITLRPTIRQTYKHGYLWGKYPTVDWQNSYQKLDFLKDIQRQHHQEWTLEMLRFSFDPNHSTTPIVRPPWIPHSGVERYYM